MLILACVIWALVLAQPLLSGPTVFFQGQLVIGPLRRVLATILMMIFIGVVMRVIGFVGEFILLPITSFF